MLSEWTLSIKAAGMRLEQHNSIAPEMHTTPNLQVSRPFFALTRPLLQLFAISWPESALEWLRIRCQARRKSIALERI